MLVIYSCYLLSPINGFSYHQVMSALLVYNYRSFSVLNESTEYSNDVMT